MTTQRDRDYELVVVSYHSRQALSRLLDGVDGVPMIVVDNSAGVDGVRDLTRTRRGIRCLDAGGNVGFAAAANLGVAASDADVVILVNPDCLPALPVLDELAETLRKQLDVAACAPALRGPAGRMSRMGGGGWAPTLSRCLVHALGGHLLLRHSGIWLAPRPGEVLEVGWLAGACLAVRRSTFQAVGGFDERYFLYSEDMALGDCFQRLGMRQVLRGDLAVEHLGGRSSAVPPIGLWLLRAGSLGRYIDDHNGSGTALCMRAALSAGSLLRALAFSLTPRHRHRCREMLTYVLGVLRPDRAISVGMASLSADTTHHRRDCG